MTIKLVHTRKILFYMDGCSTRWPKGSFAASCLNTTSKIVCNYFCYRSISFYYV